MIDSLLQLQKFADLVIRMRAAQRRYFKARGGSPEKRPALDQAMALEQEVDRAAAAIVTPTLEV